MRNLDKEIAIIQKFKAEHPDKAYKLYIEPSDDFDFHDETESEDYIAVLIADPADDWQSNFSSYDTRW